MVAPPLDYLARAREITREHGALLWLDEIQTGIGRTGAWYAHQNPAVADSDGRRRRHRHRRQGPRGRLPDRRLHRHRRGGRPAPARQPRHHVRRQPGRRRGGARRARHHREGRAARARHRARSPAARGAGRRRPRHRGARGRSADRPRPHRGGVGRGRSPLRSRRASSSTTRPRSGSGWPRRWCSPTSRPTRSSPPGPASSTRRTSEAQP